MMFLEDFQSENKHDVSKKMAELIVAGRLRKCMHLDIDHPLTISPLSKSKYRITCWKSSFYESNHHICPIDCCYYKSAKWRGLYSIFYKLRTFIKWFAVATPKVQMLILLIVFSVVVALIFSILPADTRTTLERLIMEGLRKWIPK